jgi:hypothetical protein
MSKEIVPVGTTYYVLCHSALSSTCILLLRAEYASIPSVIAHLH